MARFGPETLFRTLLLIGPVPAVDETEKREKRKLWALAKTLHFK